MTSTSLHARGRPADIKAKVTASGVALETI
jgi:hypothetical protein